MAHPKCTANGRDLDDNQQDDESVKSLLDHALNYAARGWSIIPAAGKKAACRWKAFQKHPADERTLRRLFAKQGVTGLAVTLGRASGGLTCRDYDVAEAYHHWARINPDLAATLPTVQTSRGFHVYFDGPDEFVHLDDGEYRGTPGQFCLLPPSRHPDGSAYRWLVPLPNGPLPSIDPIKVGLLPSRPHGFTPTNPNSLHALVCVTNPDVQKAIMASLPTRVGQRNRKIFELAVALKRIEDLASSPRSLRVIFAAWHRLALPVIGTKEFDESWMDFVIAWRRARSPITMADVLRQARKAAVPTCGQTYADEMLRLLVKICACLQEMRHTRSFYLSARQAAKLLGTYPVDAWRMMQTLQFDGVIQLVQQGTLGEAPTDNLASEYRFTGEV